MTVPRLTIGLPVYNGAEYLAASLDSLLAQTFTDFELIVSDNASTDGTAEIGRRYAARDPRVRYVRQLRNIGAAGNHNLVVEQARGELFKWASHDDLYSPDLLSRCVQVLDGRPEVVIASCWTAFMDPAGRVTHVVDVYPADSDSPRAPERYRGLLFGVTGDDDYGVIRTAVLRRTPLSGSHYHADRTLVMELCLHGPFHRIPEPLYFRRDLPDRAGRPEQGIRDWCVTHDPRRADRLRHPTARLVAEYVWSYVAGIRRAPLDAADKARCYRGLAGYLLDRAVGRGRAAAPPPHTTAAAEVRPPRSRIDREDEWSR